MAQLVFLFSKAPHGSSHGREALEAALAAAAFEQEVVLVFEGEGVLQLLDAQAPRAIGEKDIAAAYKALSLYDIDRVYVHVPSLTARGLNRADLLIDIEPARDEEIRALLRAADQVLSF